MNFKDITQIVEPYRSLLLKLKEVLLEYFKDNLISIILYGSIARNEIKKCSDIDLIIIVKNLPKSKFKRQDMFIEVEEKLDEFLKQLEDQGYHVDFSPILKTPEEAIKVTPLYLDLVEDAVIIFDKNNFFKNILLKLKEKLQELDAERVKYGKLWYWRLKKDYKFGEVIEI